MIPDSPKASNKEAVTSSTQVQEQEGGLGWGEPQDPGDLAPTELRISDADRPVEQVHSGNDGQHQGVVQEPHPSPPSARPGETNSRKRSSSFPPPGDERQEHHSPVKKTRGESKAASADGPAAVDDLRIGGVEIRKDGKMNTEFISYFSSKKRNFILIKYLDLPKSIESVKKTLNRNNNNSPNSNLCADGDVRDRFLNERKEVENKVRDKNQQYAFAFLTDADQRLKWKIGPEFPDEEKNHSEDILVKKITGRFKSGEIIKNSHLYIFSLNSPCLGKQQGRPCTVLLTALACGLFKEYNIKTYIGFSVYYGFAGPIISILDNSLKDPKYNQLVKKAVTEIMDSKPQYKFSLKKIKKFVSNCVKNATEGGDQDELLERLDQFKTVDYESFNTQDGWRNKINDIVKQFEELLRGKADEDRFNHICEAFRSDIEEWWSDSEGLALLSEHINRTALQFFIQDIQKLLQDLLPLLLTDDNNNNLRQENLTDGTSVTRASFLKFIEVPF